MLFLTFLPSLFAPSCSANDSFSSNIAINAPPRVGLRTYYWEARKRRVNKSPAPGRVRTYGLLIRGMWCTSALPEHRTGSFTFQIQTSSLDASAPNVRNERSFPGIGITLPWIGTLPKKSKTGNGGSGNNMSHPAPHHKTSQVRKVRWIEKDLLEVFFNSKIWNVIAWHQASFAVLKVFFFARSVL